MGIRIVAVDFHLERDLDSFFFWFVLFDIALIMCRWYLANKNLEAFELRYFMH